MMVYKYSLHDPDSGKVLYEGTAADLAAQGVVRAEKILPTLWRDQQRQHKRRGKHRWDITREKVEGEPSPMFPIDGAGSILFGAWLVIMPEFFVNILMYILGALLVIAGVQQIAMLVSARKWSMVPFGFYVMPALILLTGIMIIAYPFGAAANTFVIFGVASIFYGIIELINWYKFRQR